MSERGIHTGAIEDIRLDDVFDAAVDHGDGSQAGGMQVMDGARFGKPFPIAATEQRETLPRVHLVGPNRYLVTWTTDSGPFGVPGGMFVTLPQ